MGTNIAFDIIARDKASRSILGVGKSVDTTTHKLAAFAAKGVLAFAAVATAAGVFAFKVGSSYVASLNKIQALTGANNDVMTRAAKTLESNAGLYAKMGQTVGDAAAGVVELTKAGLSLHDSLKAVNATMILAKAGEMSVADASTLVANSLNTFGLKAKDAAKIANQLANAANISSADVSDLAESFKYVAPIAASVGVTMGQVNAVLAELSNSGMKASVAGTGLRKFLLSLQAPGEGAAGVLAGLGVEIFNAQGKMKPLGVVIDQLNKSMAGLSDEQRQADLKSLFGLQGIAAATTIIKGGAKGLDEYTKGVNRAGAAQKLAEAQSKGLAGTLSMLKANFISTTQSLYRQYSPAINAALLSTVAWVSKIRTEAIPYVRAFANVIENKVPAIVAFARQIAHNLQPALENLQKELKKDRPAVLNLVSAIKTAAPQISKMTAHIADLGSTTSGKTSPAWAKFVRILGGAGLRYIGNWIRTAGQLATGLDGVVSQAAAVTKGISNLGTAFKTAGSKAAAFAGTIGGKIKAALADAGTWLYQAGQEVVQGLINGIESKASGLLSIASGLGSKVSGAFKGALGIHSPSRVFIGHGQMIMEGLIRGIDSRKVALEAVMGAVTSAVQAAGSKLRSAISNRNSFAAGFQSFTSSAFGADYGQDADGNDNVPTADSILTYARSQAAQAHTVKTDVKKLVKMGLSPALIRQLQASGSSGIAEIQALAGGTRAQVQEYNSLNKQTSSDLHSAGMTAANRLYGKDIKHDRQELAERQRLRKAIEELVHSLKHPGKYEYTIHGNDLVAIQKKVTRTTGKKP